MTAPPVLPEPGACAGHDPRWWLVEDDEPFAAQLRQRAKRVCAHECPAMARLACLRHALANDEPAGIWGGLEPRERRAMAGLRGWAETA